MLSDLPADLPTPHKRRVLIDGEGREGQDAILNSVRKLIELGYLVDENDLAPAHE